MMKNRCDSPTHPQRQYWGQKGIEVCPEWQQYETFAAWARANGYREGLYLDRRENHLDYCPENCRWITSQQSAANRGTTKLTPDTVAEIRRRYAAGEMQKNLAVEFGIARNTVSNTVTRKNWK